MKNKPNPSERISLTGIINHFKKFADKQNWGMESYHAKISCWGESETLEITMYTKEKTDNHQSKFAISAQMDADNYSLDVMELKLKAEYAERAYELDLPY